jgi:methylated-DNA-[protein]-cysteine S-methyltransferase
MKNSHTLKTMIGQAKASGFQKKVWEAILSIPKGEVRTYTWIAERIGRPKAVRAVGNAVGQNPFAPDIPCHRVVRKDGNLGGYSGQGGIVTKKALLKKEGFSGLSKS